MRKYLDDVLITTGCLMVTYATYRISLTAAIYVGGFLLIGFGVFVGIIGKARRK